MKTPTPMTPFDEATSSGLRMLKLFLPFLPASTQNLLAVFIKFTELQNVLHQYNPSTLGTSHLSHGLSIETPFRNGDFSILKDLFPYLTSDEQQMFSMMKNMREMLSIAELMNSSMDSGTDPTSLLMGMLSPEQQNVFHTYSELFSQSFDFSSSDEQEEQTNKETVKGDFKNEKLDKPSRNENNRSAQASADQNSRETDTGEIRK